MSTPFIKVISRLFPEVDCDVRYIIQKDKNTLQTLFEPQDNQNRNNNSPSEDSSDETAYVQNAPHITAEYSFDWIDDSPTQKTFFQNSIEQVVRNVLDGNNTTLFVFGTNKDDMTYLSQGILTDPTQLGLIPRTVLKLLQHISKQPGTSKNMCLLASSFCVCVLLFFLETIPLFLSFTVSLSESK